VDAALGNTVSAISRYGLDGGRTLMHSWHEESIAELASSFHDTNNTLLPCVSSGKLVKVDQLTREEEDSRNRQVRYVRMLPSLGAIALLYLRQHSVSKTEPLVPSRTTSRDPGSMSIS
jgi:hypothetical protein